MTPELQRLTDAVAANKSAVDSLIELVKGLAQLIRDTAGNAAAANALADSLEAETGQVTQAVSENTI